MRHAVKWLRRSCINASGLVHQEVLFREGSGTDGCFSFACGFLDMTRVIMARVVWMQYILQRCEGPLSSDGVLMVLVLLWADAPVCRYTSRFNYCEDAVSPLPSTRF
jgi:hypothetical protein